MKSRITLDVDYHNQPEIKIEHIDSHDMRDKSLSLLLRQINYPNGYGRKSILKNLPHGVFVIKEYFEPTLPSSDKKEYVDTYTLVPINRIDFSADINDEDINIIEDLKQIRAFLSFMNLDMTRFNRIEEYIHSNSNIEGNDIQNLKIDSDYVKETLSNTIHSLPLHLLTTEERLNIAKIIKNKK